MRLTYGELEEFFAHIHRVAPSKRTALKGRLKHFQRLSWPAGTNKGKGARVQYGIGQTMSLAVALEMLQLGMTPERVVMQLYLCGGMLAEGFLDALRDCGPDADPIYFIFSPEGLAGLRRDDDELTFQALMSSRKRFAESLDDLNFFSSSRRFAVINLTDLLNSYVDYFTARGLETPQNLEKPLKNWLEVERRAFEARMEDAVGAQET